MKKPTGLLLAILLCSISYSHGQGFKTKWNTLKTGETDDKTILIKTNGALIYDYNVDIDEDGIMDFTNVKGDLEIQFDEPGEKIIEISGKFPHWDYGCSLFDPCEMNKLIEVMQWGNIAWKRFDRMFKGGDVITISALDAPDLTNVDSLSYTFAGIKTFDGDINHWDVSNIKKLNYTFCRNHSFNSELDKWDVSNVTDMRFLFDECELFNGNISNWKVSGVTSMQGMFAGTGKFDIDISSWDVSRVTDFSSMFERSGNFNQDLDSWEVSNGLNFSGMFYDATNFNGDLSTWDISSATDLSFMFSSTEVFNGHISNWNLENVEDLSSMFSRAKAFNQDLSNWNVSNVESMSSLFWESEAFNQDISSWDVSMVKNFTNTFKGASNFNHDLSTWNTSSAMFFSNMFEGAINFNQDLSSWNYDNAISLVGLKFFVANSGLSIKNYDQLLIKMKEVSVMNVHSFGLGLEYCNGQEARDYLINTMGWDNFGDEKNCFVSTLELSQSLQIYGSFEGIHLNMDSPSDRNIHLALIDLQGRSVANYVHPSGESQSIFNSSNIPTGVYFIKAPGSTIKVYIP